MTPYGTISTGAKVLLSENPKAVEKHILNSPEEERALIKGFVDDFQFLKVNGHEFYDSDFDDIYIPTFDDILGDGADPRQTLNSIYLILFAKHHPLYVKHNKCALAINQAKIEAKEQAKALKAQAKKEAKEQARALKAKVKAESKNSTKK